MRGGYSQKLATLLIELKVDLLLHEIPFGEICVVGSSIMAVYGIRGNRDIDFVMTSDYRNNFASSGVISLSENVDIASKNWHRSRYRQSLTDDELIINPQYHFVYNGIKFAKLELLLERKECDGRDKDKRDVELIQQYMHR